MDWNTFWLIWLQLVIALGTLAAITIACKEYLIEKTNEIDIKRLEEIKKKHLND